MGEVKSTGSMRRSIAAFFDRPYWREVRWQAWTDTWEWISDNLGTDAIVGGVPGIASGVYHYETGGTAGVAIVMSVAVALGTWLITGLVVFIYHYNRAPAELARKAVVAGAAAAKEAANDKQTLITDQHERERELMDTALKAENALRQSLAERDQELAEARSRLNAYLDARPDLHLVATWRQGNIPPWPKGSERPADGVETVWQTTAKMVWANFLVIIVDNRPTRRVGDQSVAKNVNAMVSIYDGPRIQYLHRAAWFEEEPAERDPEKDWLPFLTEEYITIEPGVPREIAVFVQFDHEDGCWALQEFCCLPNYRGTNDLTWQDRRLRVVAHPLRIVVSVQAQNADSKEIEMTLSHEPGGQYVFDSRPVVTLARW